MIQLKVGPRQSVSYAKESKELLDPRRRRIVELRESGKTFREIGEALGVSRSYAQSLYSRAVRRMLRSGDPLAALSQRARNCLAREGLETREQVIAVIARGLLHPQRNPLYGPKTHAEICHWAGVRSDGPAFHYRQEMRVLGPGFTKL
jgi:hypothetical protein